MGTIDLDPASTDVANEVIGATQFYTQDDDGLQQDWYGNVWMNPPYAQPLIDQFCSRLVEQYNGGYVESACVLVNNATETQWFQKVARVASMWCFITGRVTFWHPDKESATPLQGQVVLYLGTDVATFKHEFGKFGVITRR